MNFKAQALVALFTLAAPAAAFANGAADAARNLGYSAAPAGWYFQPKNRANPPSTIYKKPARGTPVRR